MVAYISRGRGHEHRRKQDASFNATNQRYAKQFGDAIVTNTYLKIALLAMPLVSAGLIYAPSSIPSLHFCRRVTSRAIMHSPRQIT
jgi:hypothetical protein